MSTGKKTTVEQATDLAEGLLEELGLLLWDVTFAKEGSVWILRYLVDKEDGIDINDCEAFSRGVELLLDQADFIGPSYTLEVSSPGVERDLTQDWHFEACMGDTISVRLIRPVDNVRDFVGILSGYQEGMVTLDLPGDTQMSLKRSEAAYIRLYYEF